MTVTSSWKQQTIKLLGYIIIYTQSNSTGCFPGVQFEKNFRSLWSTCKLVIHFRYILSHNSVDYSGQALQFRGKKNIQDDLKQNSNQLLPLHFRNVCSHVSLIVEVLSVKVAITVQQSLRLTNAVILYCWHSSIKKFNLIIGHLIYYVAFLPHNSHTEIPIQ